MVFNLQSLDVTVTVYLRCSSPRQSPKVFSGRNKRPDTIEWQKTILCLPILGDPGAVSGDGEKSKTGEKEFRRRKRLFPVPTNCPWVSEDDVYLQGMFVQFSYFFNFISKKETRKQNKTNQSGYEPLNLANGSFLNSNNFDATYSADLRLKLKSLVIVKKWCKTQRQESTRGDVTLLETFTFTKLSVRTVRPRYLRPRDQGS